MNKQIQQLNNTTYKTTPKDDPKDRIEVIIGDDKEQDFKPQVKLMRWDNEVNFSVRLKEYGTETPTVISKDDKVTWDKGNFKIEFYEAENAHKFVWYLKEKPATNKVEFTIQSKGLKFYYQPELTQEEKDDGASRPENVVGSYAVYMENPGTNWVGGKEYKAGKFGHIYRPHLYDSNGLEAWGDLHIENGIYSVEIPQEFLDNAVYPIKSNDELGYTGEPLTLTYLSADYIRGNKITGAAGTLSSASLWARGRFTTIHGKIALYKVSDDTLVDYENAQGTWTTTKSTQTITFKDSETISAIDYYLYYRVDDNSNYYYDSISGATLYYPGRVTYSSAWLATESTPTTYSNQRLGSYITYTPSTTTYTSPLPAFRRQ